MLSRGFWDVLLPVLLVGLLLLPGTAAGQTLDDVMRYSERLPAAGGPRAGMAGAGLFVGVEDPSTLFGNPAGLGWMSASMLGGDFAVQRARSNTRFTTPDETTSANRTVSDYQLGSLAGAYSFPTERGSFVLGISLHQTNTYERGFDISGTNRSNSITGTFLPNDELAFEAGAIGSSLPDSGLASAANPRAEAVEGQMLLEQQEDFLRSGQMNEFSIGAAIEVAPGMMLGGGVNFAFGAYTSEQFYRETDASRLLPPEGTSDLEPPYDPYYVILTNPADTLEGFHSFQLEERIDADLSGVNLRVGFSAQFTKSLRAGLLIESPTWLNIDEVYGTQMGTTFDCDSLGCSERGVPGFESGSLTGNEFEYSVRTPWRIGAGLQYTLVGLTVAGDVEMVDWTQARVRADDASYTDLNRRIQDLDATFNFRGGAEYAFDEAAVRAGVAYRPDPRNLDFQNIDGQTTNGDRLFLSAGASYRPSEQFALHLNWLQERFDDQFASYAEGPLVRERLARNQFQVGVTYRLQQR